MLPVNQYIDHTILKPTCLVADIHKVCEEAKMYAFAAVCVPPNFVKLAKELTTGSDVKVATVIGSRNYFIDGGWGRRVRCGGKYFGDQKRRLDGHCR